MKLSGIRLAWVGLSVLVVAVAAAPKEGEKGVGAFASLEKNQSVTLKEVAGRYEIVVVPGVEDGHRIVEIGQDSIVLLDPSGVTETRIPIYSIKAITVTRLPKK